MPYLAPTQYADRQALLANTDAQEQATESSRLRNILMQKQDQLANQLRQVYQQGQKPTVEQIGAVDPNAALEYENNSSLQAQRDLDNRLKVQNAVKGLSTQMIATAERYGFKRDDPSTYGVLEQLAPKFQPLFEGITGTKGDGQPVSAEHIIMMADLTPGEIAQQKTQAAVGQLQQTIPLEVEKARQEAQVRAEAELGKQRQLQPMEMELERYKNQLQGERESQKANIDVSKEQQKLNQQADRDYVAATSAIDEALPLLKVATQSGIGKNIDAAMAYFGKSTEGADAAAALKTIGARLVGFQPKMSGPQSDKDAQLYREMSGQIGDDSLPMSRRIKALQSVKNLMDSQAKYRGSAIRGQGVIGNAQNGSWGESSIPQGAIIQVSPSTGKKRYSIDGGNSWNMVK